MEDTGSDALVGRAAQEAVLQKLLMDLTAGRGRSVLVEGEPGIGKSALVATVLARARTLGLAVRSAACDELGRPFPLAVLSRLLRDEARGESPRPAGAATAESSSPESQSSTMLPSAHAPVAAGWSVPVLAGDPVAAAVEVLYERAERLCAAGPLVLAIDDLQWADEASLLLWRRLSRAASQLPLLVVAVARPVPARDGLDSLRRELHLRGGVSVAVGPLAGTDVAALARRWAGGVPGPRLSDRLDAAAGNPLYVRELLDAMHRMDGLTLVGGVVELAVPSASAASAGPAASGAGPARETASDPPDSLAAAISDRLDFLSADCLKALRTAALLGPDFAAADLPGLLDRTPGALAALLEEAITAGVLVSDGARLRFRHGLIKQALYEATPSAVRAMLQRHAAQTMIAGRAPIERVARMLLLDADALDGWELDWLATNLGPLVGRAPAVAADLAERALPHADETDPRHAVLLDHLAMLGLHLGRYERAEQITRAILARPADPHRHGQAAWILGTVLMRAGRVDQALRVVADARADAGTPPLWRARVTALYANLLMVTRQLAEAARAAAEALAEGERLDDAMSRAYALHVAAGERGMMGDVKASLLLLERAAAETAGDPRLVDLHLIVLGNLGAMLAEADRHDEAEGVVRRARTLAERIGTPRLATVQMHVGSTAFERGRWDDAAAEFEALAESGTAAFQRWLPLVIHSTMAVIAVHRDDLPAAVRHLDVLREEGYVSGEENHYVYLRLALALVAARGGNPDEAVATLVGILDPDHPAPGDREQTLPTLVRLALEAGTTDIVKRTVALTAQDAQEGPFPRARAVAQWCRGLAEADAAPIYEAVAAYRAAGRPLELGNALEDAAVVEAQAGHHDAARAALAEAMACYTDLGALWDSRRAVARLRAQGLHVGARGPRRRATTGWGALTATETRVAELVAQGCSNTEIAERLVLSRRTVETHVSHILAKLQADSRRELADAAARNPSGPRADRSDGRSDTA